MSTQTTWPDPPGAGNAVVGAGLAVVSTRVVGTGVVGTGVVAGAAVVGAAGVGLTVEGAAGVGLTVEGAAVEGGAAVVGAALLRGAVVVGRVAEPVADESVPDAVDEVGTRGSLAAAGVSGTGGRPAGEGTVDDGALDDGALDDGALDDGALDDGAESEVCDAGAASSVVATAEPPGDDSVVGLVAGAPASRPVPAPPPSVPGRPAPDQAASATTSRAAAVATAANEPPADRCRQRALSPCVASVTASPTRRDPTRISSAAASRHPDTAAVPDPSGHRRLQSPRGDTSDHAE